MTTILEKSNTYQIRPAVLSTVLVLLVSVLISCVFPLLSEFSGNAVKNVVAEQSVKDVGEERENPEEEEFSAEILLFTDYRTAKLSSISNRISTVKFTFRVPRVSLDIPVPPPKNQTA